MIEIPVIARRPITRSPLSALALTLAVAGAMLAPAFAGADERFRLRPSWSAIATHESNLFSTPDDRQTDRVARVAAGAAGDYHTTIWTLVGRCSFDVERFADHPELTTLDARQHVAVGLAYRPSRTLSIAADAELLRTHVPGELNGETGLAFTRAPARRSSTRSSVTRQLDRSTSGTIEYGFTEDQLVGISSRTHSGKIAAGRNLSARDTARVAYRLQRFAFGSASLESAAVTSHTIIFGLTRKITRQTDVSVEAGPRLTDGSPAPELSAQFHRHTAPFDLSVTYGRTQAVVIGLGAAADTQSVTAAAGWEMRRALQIRITPAYFQSTHQSLKASVYRVGIDLAKPIASATFCHVTFDTGIQRGNLFASLADVRIPYHTVSISLVRAPVAQPH